MRVSLAFGSLIAALTLIGSALADQRPATVAGGRTADEWQSGNDAQAAAVIARITTVTQEIEQLAAVATVVLPEPPAAAAGTVPVADPLPETAALAGRITKKKIAEKTRRRDKFAAETKPLCVHPVGRAETGIAAWYGGKYIGRRTTSGARLDTVHATAAHRTLPLNSLARVTNLHNGRSVIVRVTDRGPVAEALLIDMSPRAAEELQMTHAGLARVMVEQVVEVPPDPK